MSRPTPREGHRTNPPGGGLVQCTCAHCGLPVPAHLVREGEARQFCCSGCRHVHEVIHDMGYERYYALVGDQEGELQPARVTGRRFDDFDDPGFALEHVEDTGRGTKKASLYLEGVHCAACVWLVENLPQAKSGVLEARLNLPRAQVELEWDPAQTSLGAVGRALDNLGYTPHPTRREELARVRRGEDRALLIKLGVAAACALNIMTIHAALYAGEHSGIDPRYESFFRWIAFGLALPVMFFSARPFYLAAWAGLRQRVPHMDLPITIALVAAFVYSGFSVLRGAGHIYFDSLAALVALLLGSRYLQARAQRAALERAQALRGAAFVEYARVLSADDTAREVPVSALEVGERVEVRSGELLPVDGLVLEGRSNLDNAVLTGESDAVPVAPGAFVHAGATNLGARLGHEVQGAGAARGVGGLLRLVEEAQAGKAPIVRLADRISRWFVVTVLSLAALTALLWAGDGVEVALEHVMALLVVSCPCALGLATPVAVSVALSRAARAGIFFKRPEIIELLPRVRTAFLDKTGTLTTGHPTVVEWQGERALGALATALEAHSAHPVAQAFRRAFPEAAAAAFAEVVETTGRGLAGRDPQGVELAVGNRAYLASRGLAIPEDWEAKAQALEARALSPVFVAHEGRVGALAGVGDPVRPEAAATIAAIRAQGWRPLIVSGDEPAVVQAVAARLGVPPEDALGGVTPERKLALAQEWVARDEGALLMVGDGVNDAAALAVAHIGVAVAGGAGASAVAADVVLTREGLTPLVQMTKGARRVLRVIHRNLAFALLYNLVCASLAIAGFVGPLLAAVLMPISSFTVILSSALAETFPVPPRRRLPKPVASREGAR